jgi:hypothetical protein
VTAGAEIRKRRGAADLAVLDERFYPVVRAKPGERTAVLATQVGASANELHRAVTGGPGACLRSARRRDIIRGRAVRRGERG